MSNERLRDILQAVTFIILVLGLLTFALKACEYEHQQRMKQLELECEKRESKP